MTQFVLGVVMSFLITQAGPQLPARIGDSARKLSNSDVAAMERAIASATGRPWKPWLLIGGINPKGNSVVYAFLPAEKKTEEFRRCKKVLLTRPSNRAPWTVTQIDEKGGGDYAQLAVPGRSLDSIIADGDINQPFQVYGSFQDEELIAIVTFIRSNPPLAAIKNVPSVLLERVPGAMPIDQVFRHPDGSVGVRFVNGSALTSVSLQLEGDTWQVTRILHGVF